LLWVDSSPRLLHLTDEQHGAHLIKCLGFKVEGFRVYGLGFKVEGFRVYGLGFKVEGLGFTV
jgi:hypothetical protein